MNRVPIRLDDFPHGSRDLYNTKSHLEWLDIASQALQPFEDWKVPYLLGVSPKLLRSGDIEWLNDHVISGEVVMHGFDHHWGWWNDWSKIQNTWAGGGEFLDKTTLKILNLYKESYKILLRINNFNDQWFIPPFNTYNQTLLNALDFTPVKFITSVNSFYQNYNYQILDHKKFKLVTGTYNISYASIEMVLQNFNDITFTDQITIHWIFDSQNFDWLENYGLLAKILMEED